VTGRERGVGLWHVVRNEEKTRRTMEIAHRRIPSSPELRKKSSIEGEPEVGSTNRKHRDEALDEMNAVVLFDYANDGLKVIARCSFRRSWNHPKLRWAIPEIVDRIWEYGFKIGKGLGERVPAIYISRVRRHFIFHNKPMFKIKIITKRLKSFLMSEKYLEGSKNSRKIPKHDLAPQWTQKTLLELLKMFLSTSNK
jgi:hypothetical protein